MARRNAAEASAAAVPEIRFRPAADVYAKASQIAESLGLTVTDVARMGFAQLANAQEIRLATPPGRAQALREMPMHGTTVGHIAGVAAAAARAADQAHVQAGRLDPAVPAQAEASTRMAR